MNTSVPAIGDVLALLDIIKNEETYNHRIAEIKKAQDELNRSNLVVTTLEKANEMLQKAEDEEERYRKLLTDFESYSKKLQEQENKKLKEKADKLDAKALTLKERETGIKEKEDELARIKKQLEADIELHRGYTATTRQEQAEASKAKQYYTEKVAKLKQVFAE